MVSQKYDVQRSMQYLIILASVAMFLSRTANVPIESRNIVFQPFHRKLWATKHKISNSDNYDGG